MIAILSPAKRLNETCLMPERMCTQLLFQDEAAYLNNLLRQKSEMQLRELMGISEKLAKLNAERYWSFDGQRYDLENSRPAALYFAGEVYQGLDAERFSERGAKHCAQHIAILSGLYGLLGPYDLIHAYRLEMGTGLANKEGNNLYDFWRERITAELNRRLLAQKTPCLINLASVEYAKAVDFKKIQAPVINVVFKQWSKDRYRSIGMLSKKARGMMARYVCLNQIEDPEDLKEFNLDGYWFDAERSDANTFIFLQDR